MSFKLKKLFADVFSPQPGDVVTLMHDVPREGTPDNPAWQERREMAAAWHAELAALSERLGIAVQPLLAFPATGSHEAEPPALVEEAAAASTIVLCMTEFSARTHLLALTRKYEILRVADLAGVTRAAQEKGLSADPKRLAATCARISPLFCRADGIEAIFSSGQLCHFDLSGHNTVFEDDGLLPPDLGKDALRLRDLPSGEICACPFEAPDSRTVGEIPILVGKEEVVLTVKANRITNVRGLGPAAKILLKEFRDEPGLTHIAKVGIGFNDCARDDEKASGFHWSCGRSDLLGGKILPEDFVYPEKARQEHFFYGKTSPIFCRRLDFIFPDGSRQTAIKDGRLCPMVEHKPRFPGQPPAGEEEQNPPGTALPEAQPTELPLGEEGQPPPEAAPAETPETP
ncbi:MAG: hypothetical protein WC728_19035 [Elusimicrobiota bacterium]